MHTKVFKKKNTKPNAVLLHVVYNLPTISQTFLLNIPQKSHARLSSPLNSKPLNDKCMCWSSDKSMAK